jgi:hypothetical protein
VKTPNGWKRIGVVVPVSWVLVAGLYTASNTLDSRIKWAAYLTTSCEESRGASAECDSRSTDSLKGVTSEAWTMGAIVAFTPVPFAWGFTYLILFLVRWIRRGFAVGASALGAK